MISIIIPVYNQAEYLAEAIESAIDQNCEVIVVDDGSTDNSKEIALKYPVYLISQCNKGLASARNTGVMSASFNYVLPLDADDKLMPNAVERLEETILKTRADVICPSFKEFGLRDNEIVLQNPTLEDFKIGNRLGYCAAIKRSALREVGGYSPKMAEGYEDLHLWINLMSKGYSIQTMPDILWMYRVKNQSMYTKALQYHKKLLAQINKDFNVGLEF